MNQKRGQSEREEEDFYLVEWDDIKFPLPKKSDAIVAVNVSGGADSALGTYILCNLIRQYNLDIKVRVLSYIRCAFLKPWQAPISQRVYHKLKDMFPEIILDQFTQFIPETLEHGVTGEIRQYGQASGDQIIVREFNYYLVNGSKEVYTIYNFTTQAPEEVEGGMKNRYHKGDTPWFYTTSILPLNNVMKDWVVGQYYKHDIVDLFETTRSCEGDINHPVFWPYRDGEKDVHKDIAPDVLPLCGECWWCRERQWALDEVHKRLHK